ncbi:LuxR C-terminal-related transcriptional regulator [Streptomyces sp. NPDC017202]|uniref:LuxR C-terminal-related transcriptional regulator n=1 Tax=Streptomyces sp. NPDC017202 TaxID=3364981 RepID=UPI0037B1DFC6
MEVARTHLLYGEWLRRNRRPSLAREHLRAAYEMFDGMRADAFAERARRELIATGEHVRTRVTDLTADLTPQESQIAALAADGMTNVKIGGELFISTHTVDRGVAPAEGVHEARDQLAPRAARGLRERSGPGHRPGHQGTPRR